MQVILMDTARIDREWEAIVERLEPALSQDPAYDNGELYCRLIEQSALAFEVGDGAEGLWIISLTDDDGLIAWTTAIAGRIEGGPKARLSTIRGAVAALEETLKQAGVKAHRICGRDWSAVLPDYSAYAGAKNGLEKRL